MAPERRSFTFLPVLSSLPLDVYLHHLPCISLGQPSKLAHHRSTGEVRWERLRWEGASGGHLPNLSSGRDTQAGCQVPHSCRFWRCPRMETPQPLCILCQCLITHTGERCLLMFSQSFLCFILFPLPLLLALDDARRAWLQPLGTLPSGIYGY